jgi:hypothetical protein
MLGQSSATMTLDTYGHLFEDRLDEVASAMDAAREAAQQRRAELRALLPVAPVLPEPDSGGNEEEAPSSGFHWSEPLSGVVPPTGFEPALPP